MPAKPLTGAGVTGGHYHHSQLAAAHFYHCKGHDCFCKDRASALQRQIFSSAKTDPQLSAQTDLQLCTDRPSALQRQTFSSAKTDPQLCKDRLKRQIFSSAKTDLAATTLLLHTSVNTAEFCPVTNQPLALCTAGSARLVAKLAVFCMLSGSLNFTTCTH